MGWEMWFLAWVLVIYSYIGCHLPSIYECRLTIHMSEMSNNLSD